MASHPASFKKNWKWLLAVVSGNVILAGVLTDFRFGTIELQLHDSYWSLTSSNFVYYLSAVVALTWLVFLGIRIAIIRNPVGAILVSIIFPLVSLAMIFYLYLLLKALQLTSGALLPALIPIMVVSIALAAIVTLAITAIKSVFTWVSSSRI